MKAHTGQFRALGGGDEHAAAQAALIGRAAVATRRDERVAGGIARPMSAQRGSELVCDRERSVGELAALLSKAQPKVSNHLACLRGAGSWRRDEQRTIHYRLADERVAAVIALCRELLHDNEGHVAACHRVDADKRGAA